MDLGKKSKSGAHLGRGLVVGLAIVKYEAVVVGEAGGRDGGCEEQYCAAKARIFAHLCNCLDGYFAIVSQADYTAAAAAATASLTTVLGIFLRCFTCMGARNRGAKGENADRTTTK